MSDSELQELHPPRRCGDGSHCSGATIEARFSEVALPQSAFRVFLPGVIYECVRCEWKRVVPLRDRKLTVTGYTASYSPCRRSNDVQPR